MEAKELRVGNLLLDAKGFGVKKVESILSSTMRVYMHSIDEECLADFNINNLKAIPLTEEWHNRFGVKKNGFNSFEYKLENKTNLFLTVVFTGDYVMIRQGSEKRIDDDMISIWNKDLTNRDMYVHEWQNLYFALTGVELTLNQ